MSMSADGLIGLKRNMGCKQRPAVVAGGKAERKLCFLRKVQVGCTKHDA
ncbi:fragment of 50S ribosomal subunit protein L31 (part 2/2) [Candidatus Desulfosporosinus infrequens]|uniref:Fragment of 50S ribosomal subunit protein L31 (Part 2/2) n=1 Tax=Candidatus Desulfosporosinus infrequens TaxID=2043169 RepID=A0A2U3LVN3_9FIRM|nr:fragment of 50S ribosomal subunit protein L31 (part 2/2) [Candidatus Desulfosporosinus infrequens]